MRKLIFNSARNTEYLQGIENLTRGRLNQKGHRCFCLLDFFRLAILIFFPLLGYISTSLGFLSFSFTLLAVLVLCYLVVTGRLVSSRLLIFIQDQKNAGKGISGDFSSWALGRKSPHQSFSSVSLIRMSLATTSYCMQCWEKIYLAF